MKNLLSFYQTKLNLNCALLAKRLNCRIDPKYAKNYRKCSCSPLMTLNITSQNESNSNITDPFKRRDAKKRFYSSNSGPPSTKLPPLMNFPEIMWPSLIKSIRNFILSTFIIKPYFDRDFSLPDFVRGSKQALEVASTLCLSF